MRRIGWLVGVAFILSLLLGCAARAPATVERITPERYAFTGLQRVTPTDQWMEWWEEAEACAGMEGRPEAVTWYLASEITYRTDDKLVGLRGIYWHPERNLYITTENAGERWLIMHEALHSILLENGIGGVQQPTPQRHQPYIERCAPEPEES